MWICFRNDIEPTPLLTLGNDIIAFFKLLRVWHQINLKRLRYVVEISKTANKNNIIIFGHYWSKLLLLPTRLPAFFGRKKENNNGSGILQINYDVNHPCHTLIVKPTGHQYNLRNTFISVHLQFLVHRDMNNLSYIGPLVRSIVRV